VVETETNQLDSTLRISGGRRQLIAARVLDLLNKVLVTLLGETATLLSIEVDVVGPDLECIGGTEKAGIVVGQVEIKTNLVVLQGNQGQVQTWVAIEEEEERQVHLGRGEGISSGGNGVGHGGHLAPGVLVRLVEEHLTVQAPPRLIVLVDALTTDSQLDGGDSTLGNPVGVKTSIVGREHVSGWSECDVHVANQVAVTSDGDRHAAAAGGGSVGGLLDNLHGKVGVTLVHSLEKGNLRVTS